MLDGCQVGCIVIVAAVRFYDDKWDRVFLDEEAFGFSAVFWGFFLGFL